MLWFVMRRLSPKAPRPRGSTPLNSAFEGDLSSNRACPAIPFDRGAAVQRTQARRRINCTAGPPRGTHRARVLNRDGSAGLLQPRSSCTRTVSCNGAPALMPATPESPATPASTVRDARHAPSSPHPGVARRPDRADARPPVRAQHRRLRGADGSRDRGCLVCRPARHCAAGRTGAGVSRAIADDHDVGRRDGRRHLVGDGPRAGRRRPARAQRASRRTRSSSHSAWRSLFTILFAMLRAAAVRSCSAAEGEALDGAVDYARIMFGGAIAVWAANTLASLMRGTGNMALPGACSRPTALLNIVLSGALTLGWARRAAARRRRTRRPRSSSLRLSRRCDARLSRLRAQRLRPAPDAA